MKRKTILAIALLSLCFLSPDLMAENQPQTKVMKFIAVMDLKCGTAIDKEACASLTDMVIEELVEIGKSTGKFTVIDRANRDKILSEQGFQQKGCVEESCTVDAGRLLGVGRLVVGTISKVGGTYNVSLQIINVQTAAVDTAKSETCKCELDGLIQTVRNVARKLMGETPIQPATPSQQPQAPTEEPPEDMVMVPAGAFTMGSEIAPPVHTVYLDAFYIDKYPTTVQQYQTCVQSGKCTKPNEGKYCNWSSDRGNHPINCVDWNHAKSYCESLGKRLPTEAEWEKAARGTDGRRFPWGNEKPTCDYAVFYYTWAGTGCGMKSTWPVGSKPRGASPYGALDMAGNVLNWVADWYDANYYRSSPNRNPTGPTSGQLRVLRGGSWISLKEEAWSLQSSSRYSSDPASRREFNGFRCAKSP